MLLTYSFDRARGCRSYQSSTSLSVSNTGNLRKGPSNSRLFYERQHLIGFLLLRTNPGEIGMKRVRPNSNEVFVPTTRSIDLNMTNVEIYLLRRRFCYLLRR